MNIVETTAQEYDHLFGGSSICYQTAAFNVLNAHKCDRVLFLLFKDRKIRLGLVAGLKDNRLLSPFSAPFGGFSVVDEKLSVRFMEQAVDALTGYCKARGFAALNLTLPPLFYMEAFLTKWQHVLFQKGFQMDSWDLNYVIRLKDRSKSVLARNAKKNLKIALTKDLMFRKGNGESDLRLAYSIVKSNRSSKGYPLSLSLEDLLQTSSLIPMDSFMVEKEGQPIASAIVYQVAEGILQVVYWGDLPEFGACKTMNFLSYHLFEHYEQLGFLLVDVGSAMLDNLPNYGLCDFKESIGCSIQPRGTFSMNFSEKTEAV